MTSNTKMSYQNTTCCLSIACAPCFVALYLKIPYTAQNQKGSKNGTYLSQDERPTLGGRNLLGCGRILMTLQFSCVVIGICS